MLNNKLLIAISSFMLGSSVTFLIMDKFTESMSEKKLVKNDAYWMNEYKKLEEELLISVEKTKREMNAYYNVRREYETEKRVDEQGEEFIPDPSKIICVEESDDSEIQEELIANYHEYKHGFAIDETGMKKEKYVDSPAEELDESEPRAKNIHYPLEGVVGRENYTEKSDFPDSDAVFENHFDLAYASKNGIPQINENFEGEEETDLEDFEDEYDETDEVPETISVMKTKREAGDPYVISLNEFTDEHPEYDKISLKMFSDGILIDDDERIFDEPEEYLGRSWTECFGIGSEDEDIVFVRNEGLAIDYEILRIEETYSEGFMGLVMNTGYSEEIEGVAQVGEEIPDYYDDSEDYLEHSGGFEKMPKRKKEEEY